MVVDTDKLIDLHTLLMLQHKFNTYYIGIRDVILRG